MNNKKTILLTTASLIVGILMPYLTKFAVLVIGGQLELSFLLKGAFSHTVLVYYLRMGVFNAVPFVILSILFLDTNRIRAREARQGGGSTHTAYRFARNITLLFACYVIASSLYINIASLLKGFSIVPRLYAMNIGVCLFIFVCALIAANKALARSMRNG